MKLEIVPSASDSGVPTVRLRGPRRGDLSSAFVLPIARSARTVSLSIPPPDLPPEASVRMELRNAAGRILAESDHRSSEFYPHKSLRMTGGGQPLAPGIYTLTLRRSGNAPQGSSDAVTYRFELKASDR